MAKVPSYRKRFAQFAVRANLLRFGQFITKSGRSSPYFFNTGACANGRTLSELGDYYAEAVSDHFPDATVLFGPAYKGITLAAATAMALSRKWAHPIGFCFDRKEHKEHGEGGLLVGHLPSKGDQVVIIDDVVTDGTSKRQVIDLLKRETGVRPAGLLVAVDRQERGAGDLSALEDLSQEFSLPSAAIATIGEIVDALSEPTNDGRNIIDAELRGRIDAYLQQYAPR